MRISSLANRFVSLLTLLAAVLSVNPWSGAAAVYLTVAAAVLVADAPAASVTTRRTG